MVFELFETAHELYDIQLISETRRLHYAVSIALRPTSSQQL
jgi:hypothetical protein